MATKKRKEQLENLLQWEKEGRLFDNVNLFNKKIAPTLMLREFTENMWELEQCFDLGNGKLQKSSIFLKHETLINLGLSILDAVSASRNR